MSTNHDSLRVTYVRGLLQKKLEAYLAKSYFDPGMPQKFILSPPGCVLLIDSEMAEPIRLKLGGMIKGMGENVLTKEFFWIRQH